LSISAVTQGGLLYGLAIRGNPTSVSSLVREFLARVDILPWTSQVADVYGRLRAQCQAQVTPLAALDMMIAAQGRALHQEAQRTGGVGVLVTRDKAFSRLPPGALIEYWTLPIET